MQRLFLASLLFMGALSSCTPRTQTTASITYAPVLIKVSEAVASGDTLTIQGRYLGGAANGKILLGATSDGQGSSYTVPASAVKSWSDTEIVITVPDNAPVGSSWVFVQAGGLMSSNGLPISLKGK